MYITHDEFILSLPKEDQEYIKERTQELLKEVAVRQFRWTLEDVPKPSKKMTKAEENGEVEYFRVINIADLEKHVKRIGGELEVVVKLPNKKRIKVQRAESQPTRISAAKEVNKANRAKSSLHRSEVSSPSPAARLRKSNPT